MSAFTAYFDESGDPRTSRYFVVAGCVADIDQWIHFEREWLELLAPFKTGIFHSTDFNKRRPPFHELTDRQADELLSRLVGVICRRINKSFSQAILMSQYRIIDEKYVFAECYGAPYAMLARSCLGKVGEWETYHELGQRSTLCFFEKGTKDAGQIEWICLRDNLPEPRLEKKSDVVPLQAADLVAWSHHLFLNSNGRTAKRYGSALDRLSQTANEWGRINLADPDRIPAILGIPTRDPRFIYKSKIIRRPHDGTRMAVTRYWPKEQVVELKMKRKTLQLFEKPALTIEQVVEAAGKYDGEKRRSAENEIIGS